MTNRWTSGRIVRATVMGALIIGAAASWFNRNHQPTEQAAKHLPVPASQSSLDWKGLVAEAELNIAERKAQVADHQREWVPWESLARATLQRARLTGSFDDFAAARDAADHAFAVAAPGTGPHLVRAGISMAIHRLSDAETDCNAIDRYAIPDVESASESTAIHGDIALYRGDYAKAKSIYLQAASKGIWSGLAYRMGNFAMRTGAYDAARQSYQQAYDLQTYLTPTFRSNLLLQTGALDLVQGRWKEATAQFAQADKILPGDWRIGLRVAQMQALNGDVAGALKRFAVIAEASGNPEPMDVLAGLYRSQGNGVMSRRWAERASVIWKRRVAQLPEAAWGHAIEHELAFGSPALALKMAARNVKARPYGDAYVALAKSWLANRRPDLAVALLEKVNASGWVTVEQHLVLADALALAGKGDAADAERQAALAINRKALSRNPAFIWLDH